LRENVEARRVTTGFEDVQLIHRALPEIKRKKINLSTRIFSHKFSAPLIVGSITGGTLEATKINAIIAKAVEELGLGMGIGSQRAAIENSKLEKTFAVARKSAPTAFLAANLGGAQLNKGYGSREAKKAVKMVDADALIIHLNALQETVQPEGETNYEGVLKKIGEIAYGLDVPVIVKETGAGIAAEEAEKLESVGVKGIDVAGAGGTSWAAVEYYRARMKKNKLSQKLGEVFWDWGIPTATSIAEVAQSTNLTLIASGGVRSGIDVAKALAIGAHVAGFSSPILQPATESSEEVKKVLSLIVEELRNVMFLVAAESVEKLRKIPIVITGKTAEWLQMRGYPPELYARRKN
jgi:isopentenyl-diphosphate delta-isomerase